MAENSILWLRRNLRLHDNLPLFHALKSNTKITPVFIFDKNILSRFHNKRDKRISFIIDALRDIDSDLKKHNKSLLVLYGSPSIIIPNLVEKLRVEHIYLDEDFEPYSKTRDENLKNSCKNVLFHFSCDHLILRPGTILKDDGRPFMVYTHFMKKLTLSYELSRIKPAEYQINFDNFADIKKQDLESFSIVDLYSDDFSKAIGYEYIPNPIWPSDQGFRILNDFSTNKISSYKLKRDYLDIDGTSRLSPYLRFGLISIRQCIFSAYKQIESWSWINELIWREFYANILFHFPHTVSEELQSKYKNIPWKKDTEVFEKVKNCATGFPIIDASTKQLIEEGWMHNRARMIFASFFTKNLMLDWRLGEEFFAQHLMDYELASNVGGWQWAASCGTDAQPYFRIFNPILQAEKFDPEGSYIKKYLSELVDIPIPDIYDGQKIYAKYQKHFPPIVDYSKSRAEAIKTFKEAIAF